MTERTIPLLPCRTIQPVVDFYTALGFGTTFVQRSPYPYAVVERGPVQLQFFGMKQYDPAESYSGCYVVTDDVDALHATFRAGLKAAYGRIPTRGLPRIGPLKDMSYGMRQFLMTDPGGNTIRVGRPVSDDPSLRPVPRETFARALHLADLFADSKQDLPGAARIVDHALAQEGERPTAVQHLRLLVLRADVARRLGDEPLARRLLEQAAALRLGAGERDAAQDALARLAELRA
ncbi:bleomycin resistance protein [Streptomyces peucetius]|uniref:VOC family protein n=1 Tax=Streptomyces peucetius TaxID=1950 RepID=A0ABY6IC97_STRPE|nr:VOC family protein [Streptomyces peucetius]UYQ63577.1 VOC family protein [Streptomyces peucetius]